MADIDTVETVVRGQAKETCETPDTATIWQVKPDQLTWEQRAKDQILETHRGDFSRSVGADLETHHRVSGSHLQEHQQYQTHEVTDSVSESNIRADAVMFQHAEGLHVESAAHRDTRLRGSHVINAGRYADGGHSRQYAATVLAQQGETVVSSAQTASVQADVQHQTSVQQVYQHGTVVVEPPAGSGGFVAGEGENPLSQQVGTDTNKATKATGTRLRFVITDGRHCWAMASNYRAFGYYQCFSHAQLVRGKTASEQLRLPGAADGKDWVCQAFFHPQIHVLGEPLSMTVPLSHPYMVHRVVAQTEVVLPVLVPPMILNFRLDSADNPLYQYDELMPYIERFFDMHHPDISSGLYRQAYDKLLSALCDYFTAGHPADPYRRPLLTEREHAYLATCSEMTIFVHGYDVPYGAFGSEIALDWMTTAPASAGASHDLTAHLRGYFDANYPCTVFRDRDLVRQHYGDGVLSSLDWPDADLVNGTGVHNWWVHMERNAAIARGDRSDLPVRMIHIAWQGNPESPLDYLLTERVAKLTAMRLALLVEDIKLRHPLLKLRLLGHSEGSAVVLYALDFLGKRYPEKVLIDRASFWQAAVPQTALHPDPAVNVSGFTGRFGTVDAYRAASDIRILYSRHDVVLGPLQLSDAHLSDKAAGVGVSTLAIALLDAAGLPQRLVSPYIGAQLFGLAFTRLLFHGDERVAYYRRWRDCYGAQNDFLQSSLSEQVDWVVAHHHAHFEALSGLVSVVLASVSHRLWDWLRQTTHAPQDLLDVFAVLDGRFHEALGALSEADRRWLAGGGLVQGHRHYHLLRGVVTRLAGHIVDQVGRCPDSGERMMDISCFVASQLVSRVESRLAPKLAQYFSVDQVLRVEEIERTGREVAAIILTVLYTGGAEPVAAMGYAGADDATLLAVGHIRQCDQGQWLFSHSGMKVLDETTPAGQALRDNSYRFVFAST